MRIDAERKAPPAARFIGSSVLPCETCGYDLSGLGPGPDVVCPECGAKQLLRRSLPPWPHGWAALRWQSGATLVLCNLCLLALLVDVKSGTGSKVAAFGLPALALTSFLSGPVVPIAAGWWLSRRHEPAGIHTFIPVGWLWNSLIGTTYLVIAAIIGALSVRL